MLVGQSKCKLDNKNRLIVPVNLRRQMDSETPRYIRYHEMDFLEVGKYEDFELLSETFMQYAAPFYDKFKEPDVSGRVVIPEYLMNMIKQEEADNQVVVFGRGNTFGICSEKKWPELQEAFRLKLNELSKQAQINP